LRSAEDAWAKNRRAHFVIREWRIHQYGQAFLANSHIYPKAQPTKEIATILPE
jgi:hypothetical protein